MTATLSVVIPAHNPRADYFERTLAGLRRQTLPVTSWELVIVDNRSDPPLEGRFALAWHPDACVVREENLGLARARVAGFERAGGDILVLVDDDNVLAPDYLERVAGIAADRPLLGTWSGQVELELEDPSKPPPSRLRHLLCERALVAPISSNDRGNVASTPWGAGMCIRRAVADAYVQATRTDGRRLQLDLQGKGLAYGGDTDIAYVGCAMGLGMGVFPALRLTHLIPKERCTLSYLLRNLQAHAYSEIIHAWVLEGIVPAARKDLRGRLGAALRWVAGDSLERKMLRAARAGHAQARRELAERTHRRPESVAT